MTAAECMRLRAEAIAEVVREATTVREQSEAAAKEMVRKRSAHAAAREVIIDAAREITAGATEEAQRVVQQVVAALISRVESNEREMMSAIRGLSGRIDAAREIEARVLSVAELLRADADETEELVAIASAVGEVPKTKPDGRPRRIGNVRRAEAQLKNEDKEA